MIILTLNEILLNIPGILLGISVHCYTQASCAYRFNKKSINKHRKTLLPLPHIEILGLLLLTFFGFGWPKNIEVNPHSLKHNHDRIRTIYLSGPMSNFFISILFILIYKILYLLNAFNSLPIYYQVGINRLFESTILINLSLFLFTLLPLYPLTGYFIVFYSIKDVSNKLRFYRLQKFSRLILAIIIVSPVASFFLNPIVNNIYTGLLQLFKLYKILN